MIISPNKIFIKNPKTGNNAIHGVLRTKKQNTSIAQNKYYDIDTKTMFIHKITNYKNAETKVTWKKTESWQEIPMPIMGTDPEVEDYIFDAFEPLIDTYYTKVGNSKFGNTQKNNINQKKFYFASDKQESWVKSLMLNARFYYITNTVHLLLQKNKNYLFILPEKRIVINTAIAPKMYWIFNFLKF